jgi:cobalt transporter subunit CbtA
MTQRLILAVIIAGLCAGFIMSGIQNYKLVPLIATAESFEKPENECAQTMPGMDMCGEGWMPAAGFQRIAATTATTMLVGAGYALLLAGISLVSGLPITKQNGLIWGLCGFLAICLAPAAGLPPELPSMPVADLHTRQIWWTATAAFTGFALYLIAGRTESWAKPLAVFAIALPQLFSLPQPMPHQTDLPPLLAAQFVSASIAANAIFWAMIGLFTAHALAYNERKNQ